MTQANVQKRGKTAGSKGINNAAGPEAQPEPLTQSVMAVVVPAEIYEQMKRCVRMQPYEDVELLIQTMRNLAPQMVTMSQGPPG